MSVLATLTSLLLFAGFAIAAVSAPSCTTSGWSWTYNAWNQNPCTVAAYLGGTCHEGVFSVRSIQPGYVYTATGGVMVGASMLCMCNTVMYSLSSACGACQGADWAPWPYYTYNCTTTPYVSWFPYDVPDGTSVPQWALIDVTAAFENDWNATKSHAVGEFPEIVAGAWITAAASTSTSLYHPTSTSLYHPTSTGDTTSSTKKKTNVGAVVAGVVVVSAAIIGATIFLCRQRKQMRVPPSSPTVNDDSQVLHRKSAVSGALQAQSGGSPVNGGSSVSHGGSGGIGGMQQVSSVGSSGFIGGFQATSVVSPINVTSQEPLASASSASAVNSPSQPHTAEDRQPEQDGVTNPMSLEAGSLPTHTTIDTPNFTTEVSESSRGAPVMPSVPSQLPSSFYRENARASANMETWRQGEYHGLPMV